MWTGERSAGQKASYEPWVARGDVTQSHEVTGVYVDGERRQFSLLCPGGYRWRPRVEETVLVLKENQGDGTQHIAGVCEEIGDLTPGEVEISAEGLAKILLSGDRTEISGELWYENQSLADYIRKIVREM